ncbi:iron chaperone [Niveispirillum lacus]|nr:DUF1801 domain-containing protein [Niveispirillum lacus]
MVQSKATTVETYLAEADTTRRPWLEKLRDVVRSNLPGHVEGMQWGMAVYTVDGKPIIAFASQKQYVSVYLTGVTVPPAYQEPWSRLDHGKGCVRFRKAEKIEYDLLAAILRDGGRL